MAARDSPVGILAGGERLNPTGRAELVLDHVPIELVGPQILLALEELELSGGRKRKTDRGSRSGGLVWSIVHGLSVLLADGQMRRKGGTQLSRRAGMGLAEAVTQLFCA